MPSALLVELLALLDERLERSRYRDRIEVWAVESSSSGRAKARRLFPD
jgi:hypothetical protein